MPFSRNCHHITCLVPYIIMFVRDLLVESGSLVSRSWPCALRQQQCYRCGHKYWMLAYCFIILIGRCLLYFSFVRTKSSHPWVLARRVFFVLLRKKIGNLELDFRTGVERVSLLNSPVSRLSLFLSRLFLPFLPPFPPLKEALNLAHEASNFPEGTSTAFIVTQRVNQSESCRNRIFQLWKESRQRFYSHKAYRSSSCSFAYLFPP